MSHPRIDEAITILQALGLPKEQQNERSALCLLALLNLTPDKTWTDAGSRLIGITPMMKFAKDAYGKDYAPNTRETFRRQTMHQFCDAGIALYNPDDPTRPVNSPKAVYQICPTTLSLVKRFGSSAWASELAAYLKERPGLAERYAMDRELTKIAVKLSNGQTLNLSAGDHSELIRQIIEEFAPRFAQGSELVYAGDTGTKLGFFDKELLASLGVTVDSHGKMPDVILYYPRRKLFNDNEDWLLLVESVTSHGPVDGKRHEELKRLFKDSKAGLVYVTAFPDKSIMAKYLPVIAWETEVWVANAPTHLIHFNGERFLGPYPTQGA